MEPAKREKRLTPAEAKQLPCPICGEDLFSWGFLSISGDPLRFKSDSDSWLARAAVWGGRKTETRVCDTCGNIQLFLE
jgi:hypothetical protein